MREAEHAGRTVVVTGAGGGIGRGAAMLFAQQGAAHRFVLVPSAVSAYSWNLLFDAERAKGAYSVVLQQRFALDTRLHPPAKP